MSDDWPREVPYEAKRHPEGALERMRNGITAARAAVGARPADEKPRAPHADVFEHLALVDPEAHHRILVTVADLLGGGAVLCPMEGCGEVSADPAAWKAHLAEVHP